MKMIHCRPNSRQKKLTEDKEKEMKINKEFQIKLCMENQNEVTYVVLAETSRRAKGQKIT